MEKAKGERAKVEREQARAKAFSAICAENHVTLRGSVSSGRRKLSMLKSKCNSRLFHLLQLYPRSLHMFSLRSLLRLLPVRLASQGRASGE